MSLPLDDMYRDLILDHFEHPRNCKDLDGPDGSEEGHNPLCGDHVDIQVHTDAGEITGLSVCTKGCAICTASGSIMSGVIKKRSLAKAKAMIQVMKAYLKGEAELPEAEQRPDLKALSGIRKFPVRIKCALLPWTTLELVLEKLSKNKPPHSTRE